MRIAAVSYANDDVYDGMSELLKVYPDAIVLFPITQNEVFVESVFRAIREHKNPYAVYTSEITEDIEDIVNGAADVHVVDDPIEALIKDIDHGDLIATVSDSSGEDLDKLIQDIEEKGLSTVNMRDRNGDSLDDFGADDLVDALDVFVEALVRYVTKASMETMRDTILSGISKFMEDEEDEDEPWD